MSLNNHELQRRVVVLAKKRGTVASVDAIRLLGQDGKLTIALGSEEYLLRVTRNGKLILTK
jgi:hemin uptake protein HemP